MPLTPETLPRHELAGLHVAVVDAPNPDLVGIEGRVVRETAKTLVVSVAPSAQRQRGGEAAEQTGASGASGERQVPKEGTTFEFALTDEAAPDREAGGTASKRSQETAGTDPDPGSAAGQSRGCEGVAYVTVDGARLLSRPARRTETGGAPTWR